MQSHNLALAYEPHHQTYRSLEKTTADDSESLVRRIRLGDTAAEYLLVRRFEPQIKRLGYILGADCALCDDLAQETMLKVILSLRGRRLKEAAKLSAYINQITRFTYYQWQRRKDSQLELKASIDDAQHSNDVEQEFVMTSTYHWIRQEIEKLSMLRDRQLLIRFYFDHKDKPEICVELDLSHGQFDKLMCRARKRLMKVVHG